jgi:hypothetical protein
MVFALGFVSEGTATYSLGSVQAGIATACKKYLALQCKRLVTSRPGSMHERAAAAAVRQHERAAAAAVLNDDPTNPRRPDPDLV